jgi:hypothetical protein
VAGLGLSGVLTAGDTRRNLVTTSADLPVPRIV